jgi:hypothetical protein
VVGAVAGGALLAAAFALGWRFGRGADAAALPLPSDPPSPGAPRVDVRWRAAQDPVTPACAAQERLAVGLLGLPPDVPLDPPVTEAACQGRITLTTAMFTAHQLDVNGRPEPFPADLPDDYREAAITRLAHDTAAACPHLALQRVDCTEFPCLALFVYRTGEPGPSKCQLWQDRYGTSLTTTNDDLVGPDGSGITYAFIGPTVPAAAPEPQHRGVSNAAKRMHQRGNAAREQVIAATGAREQTDKELFDSQLAFWRERAREGQEGADDMVEMLEMGIDPEPDD